MIVHAQKDLLQTGHVELFYFISLISFISFISPVGGVVPQRFERHGVSFGTKKCRDVVNVCYEQIRAIDDMWLALVRGS